MKDTEESLRNRLFYLLDVVLADIEALNTRIIVCIKKSIV
jgi:hypothetical protein